MYMQQMGKNSIPQAQPGQHQYTNRLPSNVAGVGSNLGISSNESSSDINQGVDALEQIEDDAVRGKRRSKNDIDGRDYNCKYCEKTYLSYPALYTHMKQKHSKGPDGETRAPPTSGRGRGRPIKNVSHLILLKILALPEN